MFKEFIQNQDFRSFPYFLLLGVITLFHCVMHSPLEITFYSHKHYMEIWSLTFAVTVPHCVHTNEPLGIRLDRIVVREMAPKVFPSASDVNL